MSILKRKFHVPLIVRLLILSWITASGYKKEAWKDKAQVGEMF